MDVFLDVRYPLVYILYYIKLLYVATLPSSISYKTFLDCSNAMATTMVTHCSLIIVLSPTNYYTSPVLTLSFQHHFFQHYIFSTLLFSKVGPRSRVGLLHCRCNHLSSFGGNFFVAPNPIDFNKVLQRFTDFDPENFVVFFVVFGIFGLYLVALVIARRSDRKDKAKVINQYD